MRSRSGLATRGVVVDNSPGTVDSDYRLVDDPRKTGAASEKIPAEAVGNQAGRPCPTERVQHRAADRTAREDAGLDQFGRVRGEVRFLEGLCSDVPDAALVARAETKGVTASVEIARDLPAMVAGDPLRLRAALENLADNAVKFTADGAVAMRVRAEPVARQRVRLVFEVSDNGIGLSPAEIKRLFRPFAQASAQVSRDYGGAGLGLVFVRRIARAMHGDLTIDSEPAHVVARFDRAAFVERGKAEP